MYLTIDYDEFKSVQENETTNIACTKILKFRFKVRL